MHSRPPISASNVLKNDSLSHYSYVEQYVDDEYFKYVYERLTHGLQVEKYHSEGKLLYHFGKICIPTGERVHVIQ
jgi:hypothetical protein